LVGLLLTGLSEGIGTGLAVGDSDFTMEGSVDGFCTGLLEGDTKPVGEAHHAEF